MPLDEWSALPSDARLWVFGTDRALAGEEESVLLDRVDRFLEGWRAHGHPLRASREWRDGRFLLVAVDQASEPPSGCSIDALVGTLKQLERELALTLVDHSAIWYRTPEGGVERLSRGEFRTRVTEGDVDGTTPVFDLTLTRLGQVRGGEFEQGAARTWVGRAYSLVE